MRVGIVAWGFAPGKTGGVETYFRNLVTCLQLLDKENEYVIFVRRSCANELELTNPRFKLVLLDEESKVDKLIRKLMPLVPMLVPRQARAINSYKLDLVHYPFQVIFPRGVKGRQVLSFMDMQQEYLPEFFSAEQLAGRAKTYRPSAEEADKIIAISDFTKQSLIEKYAIAPEKIHTIHLSYDEELYGRSEADDVDVPGLPKKYFYYPAATWPHKNHERLFEAFAKVLEKHPDFSLVLSGVQTDAASTISENIKKHGLSDHVQLLGYLPYEQLPVVFRRCFALIYPSLFEGFGIPLLEAMASQRPIACSSTTCLPEIAGDAALYVDPTDVNDIADKMCELIESSSLRESLVRKGIKRVKDFSWNKMAADTLETYREVAGD